MVDRMARRGFTLLEVMVAVAILGLGLTAILSAQAGTFSMSAQARNMSMATSLARCKMGEIEEKVHRDGNFQELEEAETGPCCEGDETPNIRCSWKIEKLELPQPDYGSLDLDTGLDPGKSSMPGGLSFDGGLPLPGGDEEGGGPDVGGMMSMVAQMAYPDLKTIYESSARRVTVTVTWTQGSRDYSFDVVQWLSKPQITIVDTQAN